MRQLVFKGADERALDRQGLLAAYIKGVSINSRIFGTVASQYRAGRPSYPDTLLDWVAEKAPSRDAVWDVATGSGQAAMGLAKRFGDVFATDISAPQVEAAAKDPKITYSVGAAERSGLPTHAVDAVSVATALHWFDRERFWPEVRRVARPGALFCAFTYAMIEGDGPIEDAVLAPVLETLDPFWAEGNRLAMRGYPAEEIACPFPPLPLPAFACTLDWTLGQLWAFIRSWSAYQRAVGEGHGPTLAAIERASERNLGPGERRLSLPLHGLAAWVD